MSPSATDVSQPVVPVAPAAAAAEGGGGQQHRLVAAVRHDEVAGTIERYGHGVPELGSAEQAALPGRTAQPCPGHRRQVPCRHGVAQHGSVVGRQDPDPAVGRIGDEQVAGGVDRHPVRLVELAGGAAQAVAVVAGRPGARHGGQERGLVSQTSVAATLYFLHPLGRGLGDEDVPVRVDRHVGRVAHGGGAAARAARQDGDVARLDLQPVDDAVVRG